jgi:hypothetical protein
VYVTSGFSAALAESHSPSSVPQAAFTMSSGLNARSTVSPSHSSAGRQGCCHVLLAVLFNFSEKLDLVLQ